LSQTDGEAPPLQSKHRFGEFQHQLLKEDFAEIEPYYVRFLHLIQFRILVAKEYSVLEKKCVVQFYLNLPACYLDLIRAIFEVFIEKLNELANIVKSEQLLAVMLAVVEPGKVALIFRNVLNLDQLPTRIALKALIK